MIRVRSVTGYAHLINPDAISIVSEMEPAGRGMLAQSRTRITLAEGLEVEVSNSVDDIEAQIAALAV